MQKVIDIIKAIIMPFLIGVALIIIELIIGSKFFTELDTATGEQMISSNYSVVMVLTWLLIVIALYVRSFKQYKKKHPKITSDEVTIEGHTFFVPRKYKQRLEMFSRVGETILYTKEASEKAETGKDFIIY